MHPALRLGLGICLLRLAQPGEQLSLNKGRRMPQMNNHQNISVLLDSLLRGYDNSIRPDFGGPPATVEVDIMVRSMGPISEIDMVRSLQTYSMDCYFRQSWIDRRLSFSGHENDTLALSITMLERIWKPDTYFYNGKQSYLHTITTPNQFVRLYHDGRVLYSSRLTIKAGCPMNLEDFPMDIQRCPLKFGSFGYTKKDVVYKWNTARQIAIAEDMKLSQFDLIGTPAGNQTYSTLNSPRDSPRGMNSLNSQKEEYSMLLVSFHLQRHMGNFLIQVYGPCVLLVVLSWVSFWLNREATADRVSLGITTVLTMTFLGLEARKDLPKVSYPTALDYFVFLSFSFIFATIIQFAVVHYFTKYGSGECYFSADFSSDESDSEEDDWKTCEKLVRPAGDTIHLAPSPIHHVIPMDPHLLEIIPLNPYTTIPAKKRKSSCPTYVDCLRRKSAQQRQVPQQDEENHANERQNAVHLTKNISRKKKRRTPRFNSVSKIDRASRVVFPIFFVTINLFYWYSYLLRTNRINSNSRYS